MPKAYILITVDVSRARSVLDHLREKLGQDRVSAVAGVYDLVATVEEDDLLGDLGKRVIDVVGATPGVTGSVTLIELPVA